MPDIKELGTVIATREMEFIFDDGKKEKAYLKVGMPFEYNEDLEWCCPYWNDWNRCTTSARTHNENTQCRNRTLGKNQEGEVLLPQ